MWQVEYTDEFGAWWEALSEAEQVALDASVRLLEHFGPCLSRPHADTLHGSRHANMKELRTQCQGHPLRTFFAFDPRRMAILLIGGDKTGDERFYDRMLPVADDLFDKHLQDLDREGLL
jgi:hypothetical protein